jgi:hypothetical protein
VKKKFFGFTFVAAMVLAFVSSAAAPVAYAAVSAAAAPDVFISSAGIETVYEYRHPSLYDMADMYTDPVLFVFEYPVFRGPNAEKMEAAWERKGDAEKKMTMRFDKTQYPDIRVWEWADYLDKLSNVPEQHFDITTVTVEYDKNGLLSMTRRLDWHIGEVHDIVFYCHTFDTETGRELEITDVLKGSKSEILAFLKKEFEAEHGELLGEQKYPPAFYLANEGVCYVPSPDIIFGYQRGEILTIPYNRTDIVKPRFAGN